MGQLNEMYFKSNGLNSLEFVVKPKNTNGNSEVTKPSKREGYRLIFDLPPQTLKEADEELKGRSKLVSSIQAGGVRTPRKLPMRKALSNFNRNSVKRSPLNSFLCDVIACRKQKGE